MKIAFLFADMLRATDIRCFNSSVCRDTVIDLWLHKIKGTAYVNCYTPAPDTPRSLACFYTGCYPSKNGCDTRIKWPKFYLNKNINIFQYFIKKGFLVFTNFDSERLAVGILPEGVEAKILNYRSLSELMSAKDNYFDTQNLISFIDLNDFHKAVDDYSGLKSAIKKGHAVLEDSLNKIVNSGYLSEFDHVFLFSDHGCYIRGDRHSPSDLEFLGDERSKIVMFHHRKGDSLFERDDKLTSIMDVLPSLITFMGDDDWDMSIFDGCSSLAIEAMRHDYVIIEDHVDIVSATNIVPDRWAVRTDQYFAFFSSRNSIVYKIKNLHDADVCIEQKKEIRTFFENILLSCSGFYADSVRRIKIYEHYKKLKRSNRDYSNGSKRAPRLIVIFRKVARKFFG